MQQKKDQSGKATEDRRTQKTKPNKLSLWVSSAHIATPIVSVLILSVAAWGTITAYNDLFARARPYLAIEDVKFKNASDNSILLLIDTTNRGERPATGISIKEVSLCAVSCTPIRPILLEGQEDAIVYPNTINEIRTSITQSEYQKILELASEDLVVNLVYQFGNQEFWYRATMVSQPDSSEWKTESSQGD